jgi:hypothetical protein
LTRPFVRFGDIGGAGRRASRRFARVVFSAAGLAAVLAAFILADGASRGAAALRQADVFARWVDHPEERDRYYERVLLDVQSRLTDRRERGRLTPDEESLERELWLLRRDWVMEASPLDGSLRWRRDALPFLLGASARREAARLVEDQTRALRSRSAPPVATLPTPVDSPSAERTVDVDSPPSGNF